MGLLSEPFVACQEWHYEEVAHKAHTSSPCFLSKTQFVALLKERNSMRKNTQVAVYFAWSIFPGTEVGGEQWGTWCLVGQCSSEMISRSRMELSSSSLHISKCREVLCTISIPLSAVASLCALLSSLHLCIITQDASAIS